MVSVVVVFMVSVVARNVLFYGFRRWFVFCCYGFRLLQDRGCLSDGNRKQKNTRTFPRRTKHIYIYIYICAHTHVYIYIYMYMYMYMYMCIYIYLSISLSLSISIYIYIYIYCMVWGHDFRVARPRCLSASRRGVEGPWSPWQRFRRVDLKKVFRGIPEPCCIPLPCFFLGRTLNKKCQSTFSKLTLLSGGPCKTSQRIHPRNATSSKCQTKRNAKPFTFTLRGGTSDSRAAPWGLSPLTSADADASCPQRKQIS